MEFNATALETNVTLQQIANALNLNISTANLSAESNVTQQVYEMYDEYRTKEREHLHVYKFVAYVLGSLIILSNLTVVISSGLILKKGQQPKSTYLLLGNVSLADTIIGIAIVFGATVDNALNSNPLCIFQIGMIVCPTMVSIFSVGLIAIDRYIYILHGLYYQRWVNATRVRICILIIWLIGVIFGFMPASGWTNKEFPNIGCFYTTLFPRKLVFFNSFISLIPIVLVVILYAIILRRALQNVKEINAVKSIVKIETQSSEKPKMRANRGNINVNKSSNTYPSILLERHVKSAISKSSSLNDLRSTSDSNKNIILSSTVLSRSVEGLKITDAIIDAKDLDITINPISCYIKLDDKIIVSKRKERRKLTSEPSIWSVELSSNHSEESGLKREHCRIVSYFLTKIRSFKKYNRHEPSKCRAIIVVFLTTGSFLVTWVPFFIIIMKYVSYCTIDHHNDTVCKNIRGILAGPLATVAFSNSILNPLIYAWWHKGFQNAVKSYFRKYCAMKKNLINMNSKPVHTNSQ